MSEELKPGRYNTLRVARMVDFGVYLDGGEFGDILMPGKYVPEGTRIGEALNVFVYCDSEDRMVATTEQALAQVGTCAYLECTATGKFGAFLNWGLAKDLLVPFREQTAPMKEGRKYAVYVYLDGKSGRIAASTHVEKFLNKGRPPYPVGSEADLFIYGKTELGYKAVVNNAFTGLLYFNQVFAPLHIGDHLKGHIAQVREDGKIDLSVRPAGYESVHDSSGEILAKLKQAGGFMPFTDHSAPDAIYAAFGMSKKLWKKSVGALYKKQLIQLDSEGIRLVAED